MSKLVDLKRPKESTKENEGKVCCYPGERERYSYGLRINLEKQEIDKLGIKIEDVKVGNDVTVTCNAEIISIRQSAESNNENKTIELQIKEMAIDGIKSGESKFSKAKAIHNQGPTDGYPQ